MDCERNTKIVHVIKYGISGGISAFSLLSFLYLLHTKLGFGIVISSGISYSLSLCIGFLMQKLWTWREVFHAQTSKQFFAYTLIGICNVGCNALGMYLVAVKLSIWYVLSQIIVAGIIAVWSYFLYKKFVFKQETI